MSIAYIERLEKRLEFERQRFQVASDFIALIYEEFGPAVGKTANQKVCNLVTHTMYKLDAIDAASDEQADNDTCWGGDSNASPIRTGPA